MFLSVSVSQKRQLWLALTCGHQQKFLQEDELQIISFDALFGLSRKKHAGVSVRPPLYGTTFFDNQDDVDEFVRKYDLSCSSSDKVYT